MKQQALWVAITISVILASGCAQNPEKKVLTSNPGWQSTDDKSEPSKKADENKQDIPDLREIF